MIDGLYTKLGGIRRLIAAIGQVLGGSYQAAGDLLSSKASSYSYKSSKNNTGAILDVIGQAVESGRPTVQ